MTERQHQYGAMPAGRYLKARFGFEFTQDPRPEVLSAQDALFADAREVQRRRSVFGRTVDALVDDFQDLASMISEGKAVEVPVYPHKRINPLQVAEWIENAEYSLGRWVEVVRKLQEARCTA